MTPIPKKYGALVTKYWLNRDGTRIQFHKLTNQEGIKLRTFND